MPRLARFLLLALIPTITLAQPSPRLPVVPPNIVKAEPDFWAVGVNPASLKKISLTFDQPLRQGFSAWMGRSSILPETAIDDEVSPDSLTASLPVTLAPGKIYVFALNERGKRGVGFQNRLGISLPPRYLVFRTTGALAPDAQPPVLERSVPADKSSDTNPAVAKAIFLTFDRPMRTDLHGIVRVTEAGKPLDLSSAQWKWSDEQRTLALALTYKPWLEYRVTLNSDTNIGFRTPAGIPLWPREITFLTTESVPPPSPRQPAVWFLSLPFAPRKRHSSSSSLDIGC